MKYEMTKTIRFGLSPKKVGKESGENLSDLVQTSFGVLRKKVEDLERGRGDVSDVASAVKGIRTYIDELKEQQEKWGEVYERDDMISVTKEYYKRLERDARFTGFWYEERKRKGVPIRVRCPQTSEIALSSVRSGSEWCPSKRIMRYWGELLEKTRRLTNGFEPLLERYESALEYSDQAHTKPNLVDFRKQFLSLLNVSSKWLMPLVEQDILFPKVVTAPGDGDRNRRIKEFVAEEERDKRMKLKKFGEKIRAYFEANGSIAPFGKATLNYYTALQKPHRFDDEIKKALDVLGINGLIDRTKGLASDDLQSYFRYQTYCEGDKLEFFKNPGNLSCIEKVQLFKPKPIPASVRSLLAEKLSKGDTEEAERIRDIFDAIGTPIDIAKEYEQFDDKAGFDLNHYPLKLAFDYAWENYASFLTGRLATGNFPKDQCDNLLRKFGATENDLKFYADLRFIAGELATVEHSKPDSEEEFIYRIKETLGVISERLREEQKESGQSGRRAVVPYLHYKDVILSWTHTSKEKRNPKDANFIDAKNKLGLLRGGLKNRASGYGEVTNRFKELAMNFGKNFAELRDKLREADNLSKISHYSVIIEDSKKDRYALLLPVRTASDGTGDIERSDADNAGVLDVLKSKLRDEKISENGEGLVAYEVSSFTSKALMKMLKNPKGYASLFCGERGGVNIYFDRVKKDWKLYQDDPSFLRLLKECLVSSKMARDQRWQENFGWDFSACNTYADIEKEIDIKGYKLLKKYIGKNDVGLLVRESKCLLFPIFSQDFSNTENTFAGNKNRFTLEWEDGIDEKNGYRIHPEYRVFYQKPTEGYSERHRFGRFQAFAYFGVEVKNDDGDFKTKSEKIKIVRDKDKYSKEILEFNARVNDDILENDKSYFYGMDRGINELATISVVGKDKEVQDFIVFKKEKVNRFSRSNSCENRAADEFYQYVSFEKRSILDITNLKMETWHMKDATHPNSEFLRGALSEIERNAEMKVIAERLGYFENASGERARATILVEYPSDRGSVLKLRMNHFQRALQFATSHAPELLEPLAKTILESADEHDLSDEEKKKIIQGLFGLKKDFSNDTDSVNIVESLNTSKINLEKIYRGDPKFFLEIFEPLTRQFAEWYWNRNVPGYEKEYKARYEELEDLDTLKKGVAANMVGVIAFLMEKFPGVIVLEDVGKEERAKRVRSSLDQVERNADSHQEAEHYRWAGTEMYRYIEKKLVQKFGNWRQKNGETIHKTPPFANLESLNRQPFIKNGREVLNVFQFGIFCYVPAEFTSQICPACGFCLCGEKRRESLPRFANALFKEGIKKGSLQWRENTDGNLEVTGIPGRKFTVRQFWAVQKKGNLTESNVQDLLVTRLKNKKKLYERTLIEKDPVFCSACGFNTEDKDKSLPININSGDEAAAYNIAKIGMEAFGLLRSDQYRE